MSVHSISNKYISVKVNSAGAELVSLFSGGSELLWQADKDIWPRHAPVLFPVVGKLKDNKYLNKHESYNLPQHGFARDREFTLVEGRESELEFELTADEETLRKYPFHFSLRIRYQLSGNSLKIIYTVFNPGNEELIFSIGAHPGFNCKRIQDESLNDYFLEFENKKELIAENLNDGLLSGLTSVVKLNDGKLPLNTKLFDSDALVFKNKQVEKVKLCSVKSAQTITLNCQDWPYFGIWTKKGSDAFVCLEPWFGIADSITSKGSFDEKEGMIHLRPYSTLKFSFSLEIKV